MSGKKIGDLSFLMTNNKMLHCLIVDSVAVVKSNTHTKMKHINECRTYLIERKVRIIAMFSVCLLK